MLIGKWYSLDEEKILRNNELVAAQRVNAFKEKNIPLSQKVYSLPGADFSDISNKSIFYFLTQIKTQFNFVETHF